MALARGGGDTSQSGLSVKMTNDPRVRGRRGLFLGLIQCPSRAGTARRPGQVARSASPTTRAPGGGARTKNHIGTGVAPFFALKRARKMRPIMVRLETCRSLRARLHRVPKGELLPSSPARGEGPAMSLRAPPCRARSAFGRVPPGQPLPCQGPRRNEPAQAPERRLRMATVGDHRVGRVTGAGVEDRPAPPAAL